MRFDYLDKLFISLCVAFVIAIVIFCIASYVDNYRDQLCVSHGYTSHLYGKSHKLYCVKQVIGTDVVMPVDQLGEELK